MGKSTTTLWRLCRRDNNQNKMRLVSSYKIRSFFQTRICFRATSMRLSRTWKTATITFRPLLIMVETAIVNWVAWWTSVSASSAQTTWNSWRTWLLLTSRTLSWSAVSQSFSSTNSVSPANLIKSLRNPSALTPTCSQIRPANSKNRGPSESTSNINRLTEVAKFP